jgi:hypothetical protein
MIILQASQTCILIEIKHILILIFETIVTPPTTCRTSMNLPALDHVSHHAQQWVTPELGLSSNKGKGILDQAKVTGKLHRATRRILSRSLLMPTIHGISFPTCLFHPGIYTFTSTVHRCFTSLSGSQQQAKSGILRDL